MNDQTQITADLEPTPENMAFIERAKLQAERPVFGVVHETEIRPVENNRIALFYKNGYSPVNRDHKYYKSESKSTRKKSGTREGTDCYYEGQYSLLRR